MTDSGPRGNLWWRLYSRLVMLIMLSSLTVLCLGWLPFAIAFYPLLPRSQGKRLGRWMIAAGFRAYLHILTVSCACRFDLSELDSLRDQGPLILAANHPSLLDAVFIVSRLPNAVCVMKASLMNNILFGAAARLARYIPNNAPLEMILNAREELQQGAQLLVFPEGTRTSNFPMDPCLPTIGLIAGRSGVPVQTLLIEFSSPYLSKAWPLFRPPQLPLTYRVRLGRVFPPPRDTKAFATELESYFRSELATDFAQNYSLTVNPPA